MATKPKSKTPADDAETTGEWADFTAGDPPIIDVLSWFATTDGRVLLGRFDGDVWNEEPNARVHVPETVVGAVAVLDTPLEHPGFTYPKPKET